MICELFHIIKVSPSMAIASRCHGGNLWATLWVCRSKRSRAAHSREGKGGHLGTGEI